MGIQGNNWNSGEACWVYSHLWDGVAFYHSLLHSLTTNVRLADFLPPQNNGECWVSHTPGEESVDHEEWKAYTSQVHPAIWTSFIPLVNNDWEICGVAEIYSCQIGLTGSQDVLYKWKVWILARYFLTTEKKVHQDYMRKKAKFSLEKDIVEGRIIIIHFLLYFFPPMT